MSEENSLTALCQRLGSPEPQARIMARQLLKRADQLARERGITREAAMEHLLKLLIQGSQGKTPTGFEGGSPPPSGPSNPPGR